MSTLQRQLGQIPRKWRAAPHRWGHSLHSMCSYMAMFPPTIPHTFIKWLSDPDDVIYDPFCGRGTTPLEAELLGRVGLGSDANPLACALARAKVELPSKASIYRRLDDLEHTIQTVDTSHEPEHIRMLFSPYTLGQLAWLKQNLNQDRKTDNFIIGALLGIIHRNADSTGTPTGLSVSMPNTFSMSPNYVREYISRNGLKPPHKDVIKAVRERIKQFQIPRLHPGKKIWGQDITKPLRGPILRTPARLIFTSPPYLQVIRYGKFNWIRLWFLDHESSNVDSKLFTSSSLKKFSDFMGRALVQMRRGLRDDGYICLVIGDVHDQYHTDLNLAQHVADTALAGTDLQVAGVVNDKIPVQHKVSRIWKATRGRATKTDRILILSAPGAPPPSSPPRISW